MKVRPETISAYAEELQETKLAPGRAGELAAEVGGINATVLGAAAESFGFFDEPSHFLGVLEAHAEGFE